MVLMLRRFVRRARANLIILIETDRHALGIGSQNRARDFYGSMLICSKELPKAIKRENQIDLDLGPLGEGMEGMKECPARANVARQEGKDILFLACSGLDLPFNPGGDNEVESL